MKLSDFNRYALTIGAAAALLAGCGGSQPPIGAPGAIPQGRAIAQNSEHGGSWMLPAATNEDLAYIADAGPGAWLVYIFSFPSLSLVGTINNGERPFGECVDPSQNVYVVYDSEVVEYPHGSTTPIKTISGPAGQEQWNWSCAVDPITGSLAVTTQGHLYTGGYVYVYPEASGQPTQYEDAGRMTEPFDLAYDSHGNLFVIGQGIDAQSPPVFEELQAGGSGFVRAHLRKEADIDWFGGVFRNGGELVFGEYGPHVSTYRLRNVAHRRWVRVGETELPGAGYRHGQFFIERNRLLLPGTDVNSVFLYTYPKGNALRAIGGFSEPQAAVVSTARSD